MCIGLTEKGEPVLGVVYDVTRDQMYSGARGFGAWRDSKRIRVAEHPLDEAGMIMLTSNVIDNASRAPGWINHWMSQTKLKSRILGSAALEAVHVASGVAHGAITVNGKLWDCAAPAAVVLEAGGVMTDLKGKPIFPFDLRNYSGAKVPFLAAAPVAHAELLKTILDHQ